MDTVYVKHDWSRLDEKNSGHTKNEWAIPQNERITVIKAYKMSWEKE